MATFVVNGQDKENLNPSRRKFVLDAKTHTKFRFVIGVQKSFFTDFGISRYREGYIFNKATLHLYHAAFEWIPTVRPDKEKNLFGLKIGYQISMTYFAYGLDALYLTDYKSMDYIITPKIGIKIRGYYIYYGYNFSTNTNSFSKVGQNQFSLVIWFDKATFTGRKTHG